MPTSRLTFSSDDIDDVEARLRDQYGDVRLVEGRTAMRQVAVFTPEYTLSRLDFSGSFSVTAELDSITTVASSGPFRWAARDGEGDACAAPLLVRPVGPLAAVTRDTTITTMTYGLAALERFARAFYADDSLRLRFDRPSPVDGTSARYYRDLLAASLAALPVLAESELLQASLYRSMAVSLLECFAPRGESPRRSRGPAAQQSVYRRGLRFIDDHGAEPIGVVDIAAAASASVADLDAAMRAFSNDGTGAAGHLRRARLDGAHRELRSADLSLDDAERQIALRWGFTPAALRRALRAERGFPLDDRPNA